MVTVKSGIFDSQTAGPANPGANSGALMQRGASLGAPGTNAQLGAMQYYDKMAQGLGPSVAEQQLQMQAEQNNRAAMQLASQGRGGNIAGNFTAALGAQAGAQMQTSQQAAMLRAAEQQQAIAGLGQLGGQAIGQELAFNQLAQQGLATAGQQNIDWQLGKRGLDLQREAQQSAERKWIAEAVVGGMGAIGQAASAMSDERAKYDIQPTAESASEAVGEVDPIAFRYQPGLGPPGQQYGASAQQLEGTSLGGLVHEGPDGFKRVDVGGMASATMAATAEQEQRLRRLEAMAAGAGEAQQLASLGPARRGPNPLQPTVAGPMRGAA